MRTQCFRFRMRRNKMVVWKYNKRCFSITVLKFPLHAVRITFQSPDQHCFRYSFVLLGMLSSQLFGFHQSMSDKLLKWLYVWFCEIYFLILGPLCRKSIGFYLSRVVTLLENLEKHWNMWNFFCIWNYTLKTLVSGNDTIITWCQSYRTKIKCITFLTLFSTVQNFKFSSAMDLASY